MTIASHCLDLLRAQGPMTADDLGEACRSAGVSAAQNPALSVASALGWHTDGRVLRLGDRYHLVTELLDGRWLTVKAPADHLGFQPGFDLECLLGAARRDGIPLAGGGMLRGVRYGTWSGPAGWLPEGGLVGLRLTGGTAEITAVDLDAGATARGEQLAERVIAGSSLTYGWSYDTPDRLLRALLTLLHDDDQVLREPVAPLSTLLPVEPETRRGFGGGGAGASRPYHVPVQVFLPPEVHGDLGDAASRAGMPLPEWLAEELARLVAWPRRPTELAYAYGVDDEEYDGRSSPVAWLDEFRDGAS